MRKQPAKRAVAVRGVWNGPSEPAAYAVAAGLRSRGIAAEVRRDDDLLGGFGPTSFGRFA